MGWHAFLAICALFSLTTASDEPPLTVVSHVRSPTPATFGKTSKPGASAQLTVPTSTPAVSSRLPELCQLSEQVCCGPSTISSADQLRTLAGCSTFQNNLVLSNVLVSAQATLNPNPTLATPSLVIPIMTIQTGGLGFTGVHGDDAAAGFVISMPNLTSVEGEIAFVNMTNLHMPQFPALSDAAEIKFLDVQFNGPAQFPGNASESAPHVQSITFIRTNVTAIGPYNLESTDLAGAIPQIDLQDNEKCANISLSVGAVNGTIKNNSLLTSLSLPSTNTIVEMEIGQNPLLAGLGLFDLALVEVALSVTNNANLHNISLPGLVTVGPGGTVTLKGPIDTVHLDPIPPAALGGTIDIVSSGTLNCAALQFPDLNCTSNFKQGPSSGSPSKPTPSSSGASSGSSQHPSGSGLSSNASIGIGVGVGVGGALLVALAAFCCLRRRRKSSHPPRASSYDDAGQSGKANYYTYREVPYELSNVKDTRKQPHSEVRGPPSLTGMGDEWVPPESNVPTTEGRMELEEQQGERHEMDARSIDFSDDDDEAETRSLEDIERVHRK